VTAVPTVTDRENDCLAPETRVGDASCLADQGELSRFVQADVRVGQGSTKADCLAVTQSMGRFSLDSLAAFSLPSTPLPAGQGWCVVLDTVVQAPTTGTLRDINAIQGDATTFAIAFTLNQAV
jgi:hypothetical protein